MISSSNLIIIPARANSKRLKNKNIKPFNKIPLIIYTLKFALNNCKNSKIVVCSDCEIVKSIVKNHNIQFINRPAEISSDYSPVSQVISYVLDYLEDGANKFNTITLLQITNPLRSKDLFINTYKKLLNNPSFDSIISVSEVKNKYGQIINQSYKPINYNFEQRSQDLKTNYYENGLIYIFRINRNIQNNLFGHKILTFLVDSKYPLVDIDTIHDFKLGEYFLKNYEKLFKHLI